MNKAFSKILILIILAILVSGGFFAWQYFGATKGWQSFTDNKQVYTIRYPSNFEIESLLKEPSGSYYSMYAFGEKPIKIFLDNLSYPQNGIVVSTAFSKLPLEMFVQYGADIAQPFLDTAGHPQKIIIDGKNALLFTSDLDKGFNRLVAVKNNDYVILIFIGSDYRKKVYNTILKNIKFIRRGKPLIQKDEVISTENWEIYTDKPTGKNPFGYSVPSYYLSMKIPSEFKEVREIGAILFRPKTGIEFTVKFDWVTDELYKKTINQYTEIPPGGAIKDNYGQLTLKIKDINYDGCAGPQLFIEGPGRAYDFEYQTRCLLEDETGEKVNVIFSLGANIEHVENMDRFKPVYNKIISTFYYEKDEIADWKTYRNKEYGFELKYPNAPFPTIPSNPSFNIGLLTLSFNQNGGYPIWLYVGKDDDGEILDMLKSTPSVALDVKRGQKIINGLGWYYVEEVNIPIEGRGTAGSASKFYRLENNRIYIVKCLNCNSEIFGDYGAEIRSTFNQMLSTFRFSE